jgi:Fe-S cluster biosynthesis and repair protein YggX
MSEQNLGPDEVLDTRTGEVGKKMEKPPIGGKIGKELHEHVSEESWSEWSTLEIKLINEYRLNLADPEHRKVLYTHMREFFNIPTE